MVTGQFRKDNATYTCNSGFELLDLTPGNDVRICQPDGTWSGFEAQCTSIGNIYSCNSTVIENISTYSPCNSECVW